MIPRRFRVVGALLALCGSACGLDTVVVFNEVLYHPAGDAAGEEFVEVVNQNVVDVDVSGWRISGGVDFVFPEGTVIGGNGGVLVVAEDPAVLGVAGALGPFEGSLDNGGEVLRLRNHNDRLMDELEYGDRFPWPVAADGSGASLAKLDFLTTSGVAEHWGHSFEVGGTPGLANFVEGVGPGGGGDSDNRALGRPVIDGSGAYNTADFQAGSFPAANVTNGSVEDIDGAMWLGRNGVLNEYFTVDLERLVAVDEIRLRNTHNRQYNDRGTLDFRITGSATVDAQKRLVGAVTVLSGRLADVSGQNPPPITVFTAGEGLVESTVRYLRFEALTAVQNNAGLNEIEVYGEPVGGGVGGGGEPPERVADVPVRINEVAGTAGGGDFWVELFNGGGSGLELEGFVLSSEDGGEYVVPAGVTIAGGGFVVFDLLGFDVRDGEKLALYQPGKSGVVDVVVADDVGRGRFPDGEGRRFYALADAGDVTPGAANRLSLETDVVINEIMYHHRPEYRKPGIPPRVQGTVLQGYGATWRYNQNGVDPGQGWAAVAHATGVGGWQEGPGPLAFEANPLPVAPATVLNDPRSNSPYIFTTYFESEFVLDAEQLARITQLRFTHVIDDGAVFYLNGEEIERYKMNGGVVTVATASNAGGEAALGSFVEGVEHLVVGVNRLAVEVHQSATNSSDVVMGLLVEAEEATVPGVPGTPYAANDEEWIELYNRGAAAVDLGGWGLERGVRWRFPAGTTIGAGGYLVVARDAGAFAAKYPGVAVVGDFDGTLGNGGDVVVLLDSVGNPADEVRYADGAPWPDGADGGGSSLELRNPELENAVPAAWGASDNSGVSEWRTYTYRATAAQPVFTPGVGIFHEVRLGLLDRGEVLIDDFTVTEDPDGAALQLVQNPSFQGDSGWRLLGTHQNSAVVDDGGSSVLRVEATARMNYMNNLIETTLKSGGEIRPVQPGTEYEISFRAKWLSGTPQFRVELYYNQWARTFILDQPAVSGTPGAENSVYAADTGPVVYGLRHEPVVPLPGEAVVVSARAQDPDGVGSMDLFYSLNGRTYLQVGMVLGGDGVWRGTIPGQPNRAVVHFYVEARDAGGGLSGFAPLGGRGSRAMIGVSSSVPALPQSVRLLMLASEASAMHASGDILDNQRYGCTIVVNDREAVYDCGIRLRGSMFSRGDSGTTGLSLKFPADQLYRGLHSTITTRKGNRREILVKHIATQAGGIHDNYNDLIQQYGHISAQDGRVRMEMARFGGEYVDGIPDERGGAGGTVFKMEGMRVFQQTDARPPVDPAEGKKLPMPIGWVGTFDIADQGDDPEMYRHNLRMNSNQEVDDYSSIMRMCKAFSQSGQALEVAAAEALNVDMWMRQFAVLSLCGIGDTYTQGNPHNLNFYVRPEDGRVEPMPWDWDFTFSLGVTSALWGNKNLSKIISLPAYKRLYYGHLRDIINRSFNESYLDPWFRHYGTLSGEGYTGNLTYVRARGNYVLSQLPAAVPFSITTNGGADFSVGEARATLGGRGWIDVREVYVNGSPEAVPLRWTGADTWEVEVAVVPGANALTLVAVDHGGNEVGRDVISVTNTGTVVPAATDNLAVSEVHYHPAGDAALEFLEFANTSGAGLTVDLSGVRIASGVEFTFGDGVELAPGERVVVVQDEVAFVAAYGAGVRVAGEFASGTRLANGGERIEVVAPGGVVVQDFTYDDRRPWPESADGGGASLVLVAPGASPDYGDARSWRPSAGPGGNPGGSDAIGFLGDPLGDGDGNGVADLVDYALGDGGVLEVVVGDDGSVALGVPWKLGADDVEIGAAGSPDLRDWEGGGGAMVYEGIEDLGGGVGMLMFRRVGAVPGGRLFLRAVVRERE